MGVIQKELITANFAENTQTTRYTATNCRAVIDKFTAVNIAGTNQTLEVWLVAGGDSAGDWNLMMDTRQLGVGETYSCPELVGQVLNDSAFIVVRASAASSINIRCSGREITGNA